MKYDFMKLKNIFLKRILKFLLIELLLMIIYIFINIKENNCINISFGLYELTFYDQIKDLIKIIDTIFIIYTTLNYYLYDLNNSPEYTVLRKTNKQYIINKIIVVLSYVIIIKIISFIIISIIFNKYLNLYLLFSGIINIIFIVLITISFLNIYSNKQYFILFIIILLFLYNLVFIINNLFIKILIIFILILINYFCYSTIKVYNKFIK